MFPVTIFSYDTIKYLLATLDKGIWLVNMLAPTRMCQSSSCVGVSKLRFTLAASS